MKSGEYDPTVDAAETDAELGDRSSVVPWELPGYELKDVIGRGGMGEVVLAHDLEMEREVALKRMLSETPTPEAEARFLREAKIQAALDHPAIVPVHELGRDAEGRPYFAMKRLTGTTLQSRLAQNGAVKPLLRALIDVCMAIERAHSRGIVHRDLKPSNIMLGDYGEVYVLDWGIARVFDHRPSKLDLLAPSPSGDGTKTGQMLGTPGYMAPEQMLGEDGVGPAADVYSIGCVLFEILTGEPLHPRGQEAIPTTLDRTREERPAQRRADREIPLELDQVCAAALRFEAGARPSARAVAEGIQRYLDGDRDLEQRTRLALGDLARAKAALLAGDRAETMRLAGRAMTLDPTCTEAVELVTRIGLEPPAELPAEVAARLAQEEARQTRERSKRAIPAYLSFFVFLLFAPLLDVASWGALWFVTLVIAGQVVLSWINWKVRPVPFWIYLGYHLLVIVAITRLGSPLVLTPVLACGILLSMTAMPYAADRRWVVMAWCVAAILGPVAAEHVGLLDQTWHLTREGILSYGTVFAHGSERDLWVTIGGNLALVMLVGAYGRRITQDRRIAHRQLFAQTWHLEQLIPKSGLPHTNPG